ncbi:MAG: hypothetical protein LAT53_07280 [Idiomarina sp.]|nr:hypothetical protein [Idiomarina sp.]
MRMEAVLGKQRLLARAVQQMDLFINRNGRMDYLESGGSLLFKPYIKHKEKGNVHIGDEAYETLCVLADKALEKQRWHKQVSIGDARQEVLNLFTDLCNGQLSECKTDADFTSILKQRITEKLRDHTVFVPCNITSAGDEAVEISFERVTLMNSIALQAHLGKIERPSKSDIDAELWSECVANYGNYEWVALVEIPSVYSYSVARELATQASLHVLSLLHLIASITHSDGMNAGFQIPTVNKSDEIYRVENNYCRFTFRGSRGNVGIPARFWSEFHDGEFTELRDIQSMCVSLSFDYSKQYATVERLLDAQCWLGDAIRETNTAVRIVKYVTCLERLLTFKKLNKGVKNIVSNRAAALTVIGGYVDTSEAERLRDDFRQLYKLRSDILHGDLSPSISSIPLGLVKIDRMVRQVVLSFMFQIGKDAARPDSELKLKKWYEKLVKGVGLEDKKEKWVSRWYKKAVQLARS